MSFNLINIFRSTSESFKNLTLNQIIDYYDDLCHFQPNPDMADLEAYIHADLYGSNTDSNSDHLADSEWSFNSESSPEPESLEVLIEKDYPEYRNDISFHKGHHWCSRDCEGAIFLCGNSYYNKNGGVTKCGYIAHFYGAIPHVCDGHKELYFNSTDSRDISLPLNLSSRTRRNHNNRSFPKY